MNESDWDVIIIGGGTAGLSAAQMLGRARRRTLVIDAGSPRNRFAAHMHAVLGHDGTPPSELLERGRAEAAAYGVEFATASVTAVSDLGSRLEVTSVDRVDTARAIVVTSGVTDELPDIPGLAQRWGTSVLHCPYCHGWEVRDRRLGVIATSPASLHQIELIRQWSDVVVAFTDGLGAMTPEIRERLEARDIRIVTSPVAEVLGDGDEIAGVRTYDGELIAVDAIFTAGTIRTHDRFLESLGLAFADTPAGPAIAVDPMGRTSHPRVWAAGNVVSPMANVPLSMGAGAMAGAAANAALTAEDADAAVAARRQARAAEWEERYAGSHKVWSGRVNATLAAVVEPLAAGRALDLGCGEGADALWLAAHGWQTTGVDVSPTAVERARGHAEEQGLGGNADFVVADLVTDLAAGAFTGEFDLVCSSFLHSWHADFPRTRILRAAAGLVAPGGRFLSVSHALPPPWATEEHLAHAPRMLMPAEELVELGLDESEWEVELAETRLRATTAPDGSAAELEDGVLLLRRRRG